MNFGQNPIEDWDKQTIIHGKGKTLAQEQRAGNTQSIKKQSNQYEGTLLTKSAANDFDPANMSTLPKVDIDFRTKFLQAFQTSINQRTSERYKNYAELNTACAFPPNTISRIMNGKTIPTSTQVTKINSVLNLTGQNKLSAPPKAKIQNN